MKLEKSDTYTVDAVEGLTAGGIAGDSHTADSGITYNLLENWLPSKPFYLLK